MTEKQTATMPAHYLGVWRGEDARLTVEVAVGEDGAPQVSAWDRDGKVYLRRRLGIYRPHKDRTASSATDRLDHVQVELGTPNLGTTLELLFCVGRAPGSNDHFDWGPAPADVERSALRMHTNQGGSFYSIVYNPWDEELENMTEGEGGWLRPWSLLHLLDDEGAAEARAAAAEALEAAQTERFR